MKKIILSLAIAFSSFCTFGVQAQEEEAITQEEVVVVETPAVAPEEDETPVIVPGDTETVITYKGETYTISTEEYEAEKNRNLPDIKIAKNARISEADGTGLGVTVMAMFIVLCALIVLSVLFMFFGKIFARKQSQKKKEAHGDSVDVDHEEHDSGEVIAAIAMALDEHFNSKHDMEDTVLTIRRMKRAYSPWNSKIYNMREVPGNGRH